MSLDSGQQAEAILFGSIKCCHDVNTLTIGEVKPPDGTGDVLLLKPLPTVGLRLGFEEFPLTLAVDSAFHEPSLLAAVEVFMNLHR